MPYSQFDVILMLFPFTEKKGKKQRPAIVLSNGGFNTAHEHSIVAMVTTASTTQWSSDLRIENVAEAGLQVPCVTRAKLFTIADDLVIGRVGSLAKNDATRIAAWAATLFAVA